jgi:hypothetical protein
MPTAFRTPASTASLFRKPFSFTHSGSPGQAESGTFVATFTAAKRWHAFCSLLDSKEQQFITLNIGEPNNGKSRKRKGVQRQRNN